MLIVATVGQNDTEEKTRKLLLTGADAIRINLSRYEVEKNIGLIKQVEESIDELHASTKIIIDMPINKIRLGDFDIKLFAARENEEFICKSASFTNDCNIFIPINTPKIGKKVRLNDIVTIGDGEVAVLITDIIDEETIKIKVLNNGVIQYMRTFNITGTRDEEKLLEIYKKIFEQIQTLSPNYIAISHLSEKGNQEVKAMLAQYLNSKKTKVIIKIERELSAKKLDNVCKDSSYHAILIDRGELGVNEPYERVGIIRNNVIRCAQKHSKDVFVSTHILESTINNYMPYRAEITDLTEMVIKGVKGIVLCKETGNNNRPAYTIVVAKKIIGAAEQYKKDLEKYK